MFSTIQNYCGQTLNFVNSQSNAWSEKAAQLPVLKGTKQALKDAYVFSKESGAQLLGTSQKTAASISKIIEEAPFRQKMIILIAAGATSFVLGYFSNIGTLPPLPPSPAPEPETQNNTVAPTFIPPVNQTPLSVPVSLVPPLKETPLPSSSILKPVESKTIAPASTPEPASKPVFKQTIKNQTFVSTPPSSQRDIGVYRPDAFCDNIPRETTIVIKGKETVFKPLNKQFAIKSCRDIVKSFDVHKQLNGESFTDFIIALIHIKTTLPLNKACKFIFDAFNSEIETPFSRREQKPDIFGRICAYFHPFQTDNRLFEMLNVEDPNDQQKIYSNLVESLAKDC